MTYAENTTVPVERSKVEIERVLRRYGASSFSYAWDEQINMIAIQFVAHDRRIRFVLPMPDRCDAARTPTGRARSAAATAAGYAQQERSRWRSLGLIIKAKLEAVETGLVTFEEEFLAHMVLPDNSTVGSQVIPAVDRVYRSGVIEPLLQIERRASH